MISSLVITLFLGTQLFALLDTVPCIIKDTFQEYPYLHKTSVEEQEEYLTWYAKSEGALMVATVDENLAGFITGIPFRELLADDVLPELGMQCEKEHIIPEHYYYIGDVIVLPACRNQKICHQLFSTLEQHVKSWGYQGIFLVTSGREKEHPLKPKDYVDASVIWEHYGFKKTTLVVKRVLPTVIDIQGNAQEEENSFIFWLKRLD